MNIYDNKWQKGSVTLLSCIRNFRIIFEAKTYYYWTGYIAVDDIRFEDCYYSIQAPDIRCQTDEFKCKNNYCISGEQQCDLTPDCCDLSDEDPFMCYQFTSCSFDKDLCTWNNVYEGMDFTWIRRSGQISENGPQTDHTTMTDNGYYLYITFSSNLNPGSKAQLISHVFFGGGGCSLRVWYHLFGQNAGFLNIYRQTTLGSDLEKLFTLTNLANDKWYKITIPFEYEVNQKAIIEGVLGIGASDFIVIDDVTFTQECSIVNGTLPTPPICPNDMFQCDLTKCLPLSVICNFKYDCSDLSDERYCPETCTFEVGDCGWKEIIRDNLDWVLSSGAEAENTGLAPSKDNTMDNADGHFMYIKANQTNNLKNSLAKIVGPTYQNSAPDCRVDLAYYAYGSNIGVVDFNLLIGENVTNLWRIMETTLNSQWYSVAIGIGRLKSKFQLSFEMMRVDSYNGILAIDDFQFYDCSFPQSANGCPYPRFWCTLTRACIDSDLICDLTDNCGDNSDEDEERCIRYKRLNFETGLGDFTQGKNKLEDDIDWNRIKGPTSSYYTGPSRDHTLGTSDGYYVYIEADKGSYGDKAWLISPVISKLSDSCTVRYYYHMFGKHTNTLNVYLRTEIGGFLIKLWSIKGSQGDVWLRKSIPLYLANDFQLIFEGVIGDSNRGDIALDDITFTFGCEYSSNPLPSTSTLAPSTTTIPTTCKAEEFYCVIDNKCITRIKVCNFIKECSDGTDESNCVANTCGFDNGTLCGWQIRNTKGDIFHWELGQGTNKAEDELRPAVDHTQLTKDGWYLYADSSNGRRSDFAEIITPKISQTGPQCKLDFYYYMNGINIDSLYVYIQPDNGKAEEVWKMTGDRGKEWHEALIPIAARESFYISIKAVKGNGYIGDIAIDDISFLYCGPPSGNYDCKDEEFVCTLGFCIPFEFVCNYNNECSDGSDELFCFAYPGRCDFEHNICPEDWTRDRSGDFNWTLIQGSTPTLGTGPTVDHTRKTADGYFLYIESTKRKKGDVARFVSFTISKSSTNCMLRFFYHMSGSDIGTLSVLRSTDKFTDTLYSISGDQGSFWEELRVSISNNEDFKVVIEATVGGNLGDIAIDDLSFTPECQRVLKDSTPTPIAGPCGLGNYSCNNKNCYTWSQLCNFKDDCGDSTDENYCGSNCDFETSLCGWYFTSTNKINWRRHQASAPILTDHPDHDHTTGAMGYYILLENQQDALKGDKAFMYSKNFRNSGKNCYISFFYNLWGAAVGTLNLILKTNNQLQTIWNNSISQNNSWVGDKALIGHQQEFSIIFEAVRGNSFSGHIALDDIKYENCGLEGGTFACGPRQWLCEDKSACILKSYRCDAKNDCQDGSDEKKCPKRLGDCNFDYNDFENECMWSVQNSKPESTNIIWKRASSSKKPGTGPDKDHTQQNTGPKNYLFADSSNSGEAVVKTPLFPALRKPCRLRFWYYMYGSEDMNALAVYTLGNLGQKIPIWVFQGNQGKKWLYANLPIGNSQNYSVFFTARSGNTNLTDIAIDDVSFTEDCRLPDGNSSENCDGYHFYCVSLDRCLLNEWLCDKEIDCLDQSDEKDCVYTTVQGATDIPTPQGYRGSSSTIWITGVVIASVLFITIIILVVCFIKKRRQFSSISKGAHTVENTGYGMQLTDFTINDMDTTMFGEEASDDNNPMSLENPLYKDREFKRSS